jgi:hypothetical protein
VWLRTRTQTAGRRYSALRLRTRPQFNLKTGAGRVQCMCITRRTSRVNSSSTRVQIQSECVRSDMFDACVFIFIVGHIIKIRPAPVSCVFETCRQSTIRSRGSEPVTSVIAYSSRRSRVGDGDGVAPTPQRERRGDTGGHRRMTTRARPGGQKNPAARVAHAYMDTQLPSVASVRSGRPTRWAGPPGRPPARSRLSTSDVSRLKSTRPSSEDERLSSMSV